MCVAQASNFNRRQPIVRKILNTIEQRFAEGHDAVEHERLTLNAAVRLVVWGLFAARSHPEWSPAPSKALATGEDAAASIFLQEMRGDTSIAATSVTEVYHAVRQLPYGGVGVRSAEAVLTARTGSCSGKHLALALLLRKLRYDDVEIVTYHCDFATAISESVELKPKLPRAVHDFHHAVGAHLHHESWDLAIFSD